jgi:hypothetical protein
MTQERMDAIFEVLVEDDMTPSVSTKRCMPSSDLTNDRHFRNRHSVLQNPCYIGGVESHPVAALQSQITA